ncbi:monovalent cation/H+ antiporter subunit D family protein [Rhodopseudomonas palustris]|uniref:complex I subunit 5 family protein n=1 Tax=Rhodopseudomonas palustris TaxID=1076 RepID=UPI00115D56B4|nr:proton-conducting transporter membrane subunit [Rhodopseudomonas palustris]QDL97092.1 monovalent cation/H+ antiporter subunit D family protein [Rhodopseudomonas palustris]
MNALLPVVTLATSLLAAGVIFLLPESSKTVRTVVNLTAALGKLGLALLMIIGVAAGETYEATLTLLPGLDLILRVDALALLFLTLSAFLWLLTTVYAISYLGDGPHLSRFFGFFSLCVAATTGVALSGSLITFFVFYELLTLSTWPLVVHKGDGASLAAGRRYLIYTMSGSAALLAGILWLEGGLGPIEFTRHGSLDAGDPTVLIGAFVLMVAGLGVKAALVPLHGWLPSAMVAPAPVSALLHAVAVVKAGAFGIIRLVYDVYGVTLVNELGVGLPLAIVAAVTIIYGSLRALQQHDIKRRLAYSTVSQVAYIVLGTGLFGPYATIGGVVHLVHQGLMKITLFFCAGALAERIGVTRVEQLDGAGRRMPLTMAAFSVAALGMIGLPPLAGFVSKWYLGIGSLQAGQHWVLAVLAVSSLLNAAYFLPLLHRAWFLAPADDPARPAARREGPAWLIGPGLVTAAAALGAGLFAGLPLSPLGWSTLIVTRNYAP